MSDIFELDEEQLSNKLDERLNIGDESELSVSIIDDNTCEKTADRKIEHFKKYRSNSVISVGNLDNRVGDSYEVPFEDFYEAELEESRQNSSIPTNEQSRNNVSSEVPVVHSRRLVVTDFQPIKVLGKGSFGKVILVKHKTTGRLYAQKQLKKATMIVNTKNYERTLTERTILEKVSHPNIVKLYYALQDFDKVYLFLEYLEGGELFFHLSNERIMSEKIACFYVAEMILALRHLHINARVIYRDLKPENCLLNRHGHLVLTDFGLSKVAMQANSMDGTAQYIAPEVIKGENYDSRCDWWSLGAVMFDLLTGQPPFTGNNNKRIMDKILTKKIAYPFYLSQISKDFLSKCLNKNVEKRINLDDEQVFNKIKNHQFFRYINWKHIEEQNDAQQPPPIIPVISNPEAAENFEDEFTSLDITPPNSPIPKFIYDNIEESRSNSTSSIIEIKKPDDKGDYQKSVYFTDFSFTRKSCL